MQEADASSSSDASSEDDEVTDNSVRQAGERLEHPPISRDTKFPMMEQKAGSNVWYRANVLKSSQNEIHILFPGQPKQIEKQFIHEKKLEKS